MDHKKQHWVPRSYLSAWCDPATPAGQDPYVWQISRDGASRRRKAPHNIFYETDLYTIHVKGQRDLRLERGLSQLEDEFARLHRSKLESKASLNDEEHLLARAFMAAMHTRSPMYRDHVASEWSKVRDHMAHLEKMIADATPETKESMVQALSLGPSDDAGTLSADDVEKLVTRPMEFGMPVAFESELINYMPMNLTVLSTDEDPGFITSDKPCVWYDPESYDRPFPWNSVGLAFPKVEVTLPASPKRLLVLSWRDLPEHLDISDRFVSEFNRRTRHFCHEHFIVCRDEVRQHWLDSERPPKTEEETAEQSDSDGS